ncbi:MAG: hypothetical protein A2096_00785 [Spirochaetes bacterium GWF1_41_5]|nr:MAG: hypothetical protein A2096_00785 [Spirochaetes bacterium GWF1_41_5]HBE03543.1 hypothetical protein [Spirochaetia bacterium]
MRILGAIDSATGNTQDERVKHVASMIFLDEDGNKRQFPWRTIYTWWYRYKNHGITGVQPKTRSDRGNTRKVTPEQILEVIFQVMPFF